MWTVASLLFYELPSTPSLLGNNALAFICHQCAKNAHSYQKQSTAEPKAVVGLVAFKENV